MIQWSPFVTTSASNPARAAASAAAQPAMPLPTTLGKSLDALEADGVVTNALGEHVTRKFLEAKRPEVMDYRVSVSEWEKDRYLETF